MSFKYAELFAGIGGFHLGLKAAGGESVFANERDKFACETYKRWFSDVNLVMQDIQNLDIEKDIPPHDVLCGGFPCQPFSIAGVSKKNSLGRLHGFRDAEQGNLFFEILKVIRIHEPKVVLLENVKNLLSHDKGKTWRVIYKSLENEGYTVKHEVINAANWLPQNRRRIFIVAFKDNYFERSVVDKFTFPMNKYIGPKLGSILQKSPPDKKYMLSDALWKYLQEYSAKHKKLGNGFGFKIHDQGSVAATLSARYYKDGAEILIRQKGWKNPRKLTPKEASRLMGFSGKFAKMSGFSRGFPIVVSDVQAYKQFGNAVCPPIVEAIGLEISKLLKEQRILNSGSIRSSKRKVG